MKYQALKKSIFLLSILALTGCNRTEASGIKPSDSSSQPISTEKESVESVSSSKALVNYTVTFDLNYEGAASIAPVTVKEGESVAKPEDPTRENYLFNGWFSEAACTNAFDFTSAINQDTTIYASWLEGSASDYLKVSFSYNYDGAPTNGIFYETNVKKNRRVSRPSISPNRDGYYFTGWFTDKDCTANYNFQNLITENVSIYAGWKKLYTFEAEDTDFEGKNGYGYSANVSETQMIEQDTTGLGASNGYFVSYLYYNGAFLEWNINSDKDIDDVTLIARLSCEFFDIDITPETYKVSVNDTALTGYSISLTGVEGTMQKLPFKDYEISSNVSLKKGSNSVKLITNNSNGHSAAGTYKAEAPMIDCIKLATDATLTFDKIQGNY